MFFFFFKKKSGADHPLPKSIDRLRMHQRPSTNRQPSASFSAVVDFSDSSCKALRLDETQNACGETASPKKLRCFRPLVGENSILHKLPKTNGWNPKIRCGSMFLLFQRVHFQVPCSSSGVYCICLNNFNSSSNLEKPPRKGRVWGWGSLSRISTIWFSYSNSWHEWLHVSTTFYTKP